VASLLTEVHHEQLGTKISKVEGITQFLHRQATRANDPDTLPAVLLFQEAKVPHDSPPSQYAIDGYKCIREPNTNRMDVLTYVRKDLTASPLPLRKPPINVHTKGRLQATTLHYEGHIIAIFNIHGPHQKQNAFWSYVFGELTHTSALFPTYIIGDTNTGTVMADRPGGLTKVDSLFLETMARHKAEDLSGPPSLHEKTHFPHNSQPSRLDRAIGHSNHPFPVVAATTLPEWQAIQGNTQTYHLPLLLTAAVTPLIETPIPDDCATPPAEYIFPDTEEEWNALMEAMNSTLSTEPHIRIAEAAAKALKLRGREKTKQAPIWDTDPHLQAIHGATTDKRLRKLINDRIHRRRAEINRDIETVLRQSNTEDPIKSIKTLQALLRPPHVRQVTTYRRPDGTISNDPNTVITQFREHMKNHLNQDTPELSRVTRRCLKSLPSIASLRKDGNLYRPWTDEEIDWAIERLNAEARPGNDGISSRLYKRLHRPHRRHLGAASYTHLRAHET